jgi:hypothetical protein
MMMMMMMMAASTSSSAIVAIITDISGQVKPKDKRTFLLRQRDNVLF